LNAATYLLPGTLPGQPARMSMTGFAATPGMDVLLCSTRGGGRRTRGDRSVSTANSRPGCRRDRRTDGGHDRKTLRPPPSTDAEDIPTTKKRLAQPREGCTSRRLWSVLVLSYPFSVPTPGTGSTVLAAARTRRHHGRARRTSRPAAMTSAPCDVKTSRTAAFSCSCSDRGAGQR
jgi:hypothetical protein